MAHIYWRIYITGSVGGEYVDIVEIEMRATVGGANQCAGGVASASSTYITSSAAEAFDGDIENEWGSDGPLPDWIKYQFPSAVDVSEIAIYGDGSGIAQPPTDFALQFSDDDSGWTTAVNWSGVTWPTPGWQYFSYSSGATVSAALAGAVRRAVGSGAVTYTPPARQAALAGAVRRAVGSASAAHTFRPPPHLLRTSYALILTGAEDGTTDIDLPLISWQAVASLDGQTVVQCVVPYSPAIAAQLAARPAGTLRIDQRLHYGGEVLSGTIVSAPWDGAPRTDRGGRSQSITLQGRADAGPSAAKLVRLSGVQYLRIDDSGATVRAAIDFFAAPGDALDYGDGTLIASRVTWICTPALSWMEANG